MDVSGCNGFDPAHSILLKETNMHKGFDSSALKIAVGLVLFTGLVVGSYHLIGTQRASAQPQKKGASPSGFEAVVRNNSERMLKEGQQTFRFDTFGSEAFWGDALQLHKAIASGKNGNNILDSGD
jgi:hypothetical protein